MQVKERPSISKTPTQAEIVRAGWDAEMAKEKTTLKKVWTSVGDIARDIGTANQMAKDKFDGDSALMRMARGALSTAVGVGLEKAMDGLWDRIWSGKIPYFEKLRMAEDVGSRLHSFSQSEKQPFDWKAKLSYLIKEGTQDLSIVGVYNFIAFRTQPIFEKAEAKHVLASFGFNVGELFFAPKMKEEMHQNMSNAMARMQAESLLERAQLDANREHTKYDGTDVSRRIADEAVVEATRNLENIQGRKMIGSNAQTKIREILNVSNPVTMLGADMMWSGVRALIANFKEVQKTRREKGGLSGKKVFMPKKEDGWKKSDRGWQDRRQNQSDRWQHTENDKDKVYYGKSRWGDEKRLEEYELKGS